MWTAANQRQVRPGGLYHVLLPPGITLSGLVVPKRQYV